MAATANWIEWLVRKLSCCGLSIQLLVTKEYNLLYINFEKFWIELEAWILAYDH